MDADEEDEDELNYAHEKTDWLQIEVYSIERDKIFFYFKIGPNIYFETSVLKVQYLYKPKYPGKNSLNLFKF